MKHKPTLAFPFARLFAVAFALVAVCILGALGAWTACAQSPQADEVQTVSYPSVEQAKDFSYMLKSYQARLDRGENPLLVFGSSELWPGGAGSAHPMALLSGGRYAVDTMAVGRACTSDLWNAVEAGAFAGEVDQRRVVIFVSMQWFMCYRKPATDFPSMFSEGAFESFMANESISSDLKNRIIDRMSEYGVDRRGGSTVLADAAAQVDAGVSGLVKSLRAGSAAGSVAAAAAGSAPANAVASAAASPSVLNRAQVAAAKRAASSEEDAAQSSDTSPDWPSIFEDAATDAQKRSSGNPYGTYDTWYKERYKSWVTGAKKRWSVKNGEYWSQQELEDFKMLLQVCSESGLEPLVIIQPVKGELYDQTVYTSEVRRQYYEMVRSACSDAGVQVADFSSHEYDAYFLRDYSHPSDLGGAYYSKAIYTWYETGVADTSGE